MVLLQSVLLSVPHSFRGIVSCLFDLTASQQAKSNLEAKVPDVAVILTEELIFSKHSQRQIFSLLILSSEIIQLGTKLEEIVIAKTIDTVDFLCALF